MAAGDIYRATAQQVYDGTDVFQWVWHYIQTAGGDVAEELIAQAIIALLDTAFNNIQSQISTLVVGDTLEVAKWDSGAQQFDTLWTESFAGEITGAAALEAMPHQDAAVVKFFTNVGRSIGKKFISGIQVNAVNAQVLEATFLTNLGFFALDFVDPVSAGGGSFAPGNFNVAQGTFRQWIPTVEVNVLVGSQDRRRVGIGL